MPDDLKEALTHREQLDEQKPVHRDTFGGSLVVQILLFALVLFSIFLVFGAVREAKEISEAVRTEQGAAKERGFQSRATVCTLQRDLGIELPEGCRQREVLAYYDPDKPISSNAARVSAKNFELLCALAQKDGLSGDELQKFCGSG